MEKTAKEIITIDDEQTTCKICEAIFGRKRETLRYCNTCGDGFCEGEHGSFRYQGICVRCFTLKEKC